jgi:Spindle and kinetochore-associated protein 1
MEAEGDICPAFLKLLRTVQSETRILRYLSQLRSLPPGDELSARLNEVETTVREVEQSIAEFSDFLDSEIRSCDVLDKEVYRMAESQNLKILDIRRAAVSVSESNPAAESNNILLVSKSELEIVPKSTRNRLTVGVVSSALSLLQTLSGEKKKVVVLPRKKLSRIQQKIIEDLAAYKHPDHGESVFVTEAEIRATSVFEAGESTGKSILHTLRAMQKIKLVRSGGENTYVVL